MPARWQFRACKYHRRASCRAHNDARLVQLFSCGAIVPTNEEELMLLQSDVSGAFSHTEVSALQVVWLKCRQKLVLPAAGSQAWQGLSALPALRAPARCSHAADGA